MLVGGFMRELVLTMHQRGSLGPHVVSEFLHSQLNRWVPFRPEELKRLLDEMTQDAGVDVRFFTRVIAAASTAVRTPGQATAASRVPQPATWRAIASSPPSLSSTPPAMPPSRTSPARIAR